MKYQKKKFKETKGITLIALVITIIVLLILAGVTIVALSGDNGILKRAADAKEKTEQAQKDEKNKLTNYEDLINNSTLDTAVVGEIVTGKNKKYSNNGTAIIPVGFAIVPDLDNVEEGLVISDKENDVNNEGNQFVWIPVRSEEQYNRNVDYEMKINSVASYTDSEYLPEEIKPTISEEITDEQEIGEINEKEERKRVLSAGGFYVSRYEAGNDGSNNLISKKDVTVYNYKSQEEIKALAKTFIDNDYVKSALCSGIQWDVIMGFIDGKNKRYRK